MAGQVEGVNGASRLGEGLLVEDPDVYVAAEAVQKDEGRVFALPILRYCTFLPPISTVCGSGPPASAAASSGSKFSRNSSTYESISLVGDVRRRDHAE